MWKLCIIKERLALEGELAMAIKFNSSIMEPFKKHPDPDSPRINVVHIPLEHLKPFADHPFKLYEGQQLEDLIRSIQTSGVLTPIIVRKSSDESYEILAGHNRVNAAREVGLNKIPATICEPESDEEARIFVVESNFNQRSVRDMKPSELANSLHMLNEAMKKKPGYRSDLVDEETGSQSDNRSRTMHVIGEMHNLSQATIARYIRVAQLSKGLQERLDNRLIGLGVAEHLSYLRPSEQDIVQRLLEGNSKVNIQQAGKLKKQSLDHELTEDEIKQIIMPKVPAPRRKAIKLREDLFAKYFTEGETPEEIEATIEKALELLHAQAPS